MMIETPTRFDFEQIFTIVDYAIKPVYLNRVQQLVLRHTYEGQTYSQIAATYCYDREYIKTVGCELWKLLSKSFNKQITKSNFPQFIRRYTTSCYTSKVLTNIDRGEDKFLSETRQDWGTAPTIANFWGRTTELVQLNQWIDEKQCRMVLISGAIGIGKTTLAVKFAESVQKQFQFVIWRSLQNTPSLEDLLDNLIASVEEENLESSPESLDGKILKLLSYLEQKRCLLILEDFHAILDRSDRAGYYRSDYENYRYLLQALMVTRHQSVIVITSWDKPKEMADEEQNQFCHLMLDSLPKSALKQMFEEQLPFECSDEEWLLLCDRYAHNPKLMKIAVSVTQKFFDGKIERFLQQKPTVLKDIRDILEQQFDRLPTLEKKIAYLLAIDRNSLCLDRIHIDVLSTFSKIDILEALKNLQQIYFLDDRDRSYCLTPLAKDYLRSKIFETVCQQID